MLVILALAAIPAHERTTSQGLLLCPQNPHPAAFTSQSTKSERKGRYSVMGTGDHCYNGELLEGES